MTNEWGMNNDKTKEICVVNPDKVAQAYKRGRFLLKYILIKSIRYVKSILEKSVQKQRIEEYIRSIYRIVDNTIRIV